MKKVFVIICLILLISSRVSAAGRWNDTNGIEVVKTFGEEPADSKGPTVLMDCTDEENISNSLSDFMYFVPLISPTLVDSKTSRKNGQIAGIISHEKTIKKNSFYVCCEFYMKGKGSHKNTFDSAAMIKRNSEDVKEGDPIKNILGYIKFKGTGYGKIEVRGDIIDGAAKVQNVKVRFNSRGGKSPVTIGLYSVKCVDGEYKYESRFKQIIARINVLEFERNSECPRMGIKIGSLMTDESKNGLWSKIKGAVANLFIEPIEIDKLGNDTMLDLGLALLNEQRFFTFPKAENLKEISKKVSIVNILDFPEEVVQKK